MAGELVVADYTFEVRATLLGFGTSYEISGRASIGGLGTPPTKTADLDLADADGSYAGRDRRASRVITIPLEIVGTPAAAGAALKTLTETIWAPSAIDIPLYMQLPGFGKFYVKGRPRGPVDPDLSSIHFGIINVLVTFVAPNPTITYV